MTPLYNKCNFKIYIPEITRLENRISVSFKLEYKMLSKEKLVFSEMVMNDKLGYSLRSVQNKYLDFKRRLHSISAYFELGKTKILFGGTKLSMRFLSETGSLYTVLFEMDSYGKAKLLDVQISKSSVAEQENFISALKAYSSQMSELVANKAASVKRDVIAKEIKQEYEKPRNNDAVIDKYIKALRAEKNFLIAGGGKKFKLSKGRLVSSDTTSYYYSFELEAELHIADASPVKIDVNGSLASGNVLMCEDFSIMLQLDKKLDDRIPSAMMSVEPWKLLEALEEKLQEIDMNSIAGTIIKDGPTLSGSGSIDDMPKGQEAVIKKACSEPVCIVWGPPGTGKTHTMSEIAISFLKQNKSVLIVSHSNVSVDGVAKKINELLIQKKMEHYLKEGKILRYGYVRDEELNQNENVSSFAYTVNQNRDLKNQIDFLADKYEKIKHAEGIYSPKLPALRKELSSKRSAIREQEKQYVEKASIVTTTISKVLIDKIFSEKKYDVVMFDEVSMAYVPHVLVAASFAKEHMICVGDFMQLAPIVQSSAKDVLGEDIFAYLGINKSGKANYHPWLVMLNEQRRMHPEISSFANHYVYGSLLKDHSSTKTSRNEIVSKEPFVNEAINLIDLAGTYCAASKNIDNSRFNIISAFITFALAVKAEKENDVSIITPYAAQTRLIRALTLDYRKKENISLRCATVHQFQGSESDVVIFDAVESYPSKKPGWLMGKEMNSILRLINVAVTRARGKLITIANYKFWENNFRGSKHCFYQLLTYLSAQGNVVQHVNDKSLEELIANLSVENGPQFYLEPKDYLDRLQKDIKKAKGKIVVSLPSAEIDDDNGSYILSLLEKANGNGVQILIKCREYEKLPENWKEYSWGSEDAVFPVIMIDNKITWYGVPTANWKFDNGNMIYNTVCKIACRMEGEHTAEIIDSLAEISSRETDNGKRAIQSKSEGRKDGLFGLEAYVKEYKKCPVCKKPLKMSRGKSGKLILWCAECKKTELLSPDDVNHYIFKENVCCPKDKCDIEAKIGKFGLYIRCSAGHNLKPEEI